MTSCATVLTTQILKKLTGSADISQLRIVEIEHANNSAHATLQDVCTRLEGAPLEVLRVGCQFGLPSVELAGKLFGSTLRVFEITTIEGWSDAHIDCTALCAHRETADLTRPVPALTR